MQYKLIVSDMDGTLLNSKDKISPKAADAINRAMEKGVYFTFATGRSISGIKRVCDANILWPNAPIATFNGGKIVSHTDDIVLFERFLEKQTAAEVLALCKQLGAAAIAWSEGELFATEENERTKQYSEKAGIEIHLIDDTDEFLSRDISKMIWPDDPEKIEYYITRLQGVLEGNVTFCTSSPEYLEFFHSDASKGNAARFIAEKLNIPPAEIIAIGDQRNDIPMLKFAGLGVAMANALDEVKAAADYITLSNDEDGIADVIERFV